MLTIKFLNLSKVDFDRSVFGGSSSIVSIIVQEPEKKLLARSTQIFQINNETFVGEGAADFWCCWLDPITKYRFGVRIIEAGQPFGAGWQPRWQVMWDEDPTDVAPRWQPSGDRPSQIFNWIWTKCTIKATPISTHETLSINVEIMPK